MDYDNPLVVPPTTFKQLKIPLLHSSLKSNSWCHQCHLAKMPPFVCDQDSETHPCFFNVLYYYGKYPLWYCNTCQYGALYTSLVVCRNLNYQSKHKEDSTNSIFTLHEIGQWVSTERNQASPSTTTGLWPFEHTLTRQAFTEVRRQRLFFFHLDAGRILKLVFQKAH